MALGALVQAACALDTPHMAQDQKYERPVALARIGDCQGKAPRRAQLEQWELKRKNKKLRLLTMPKRFVLDISRR